MRASEGKIAIYSRKSKFTGKGESIGNQIELCREYIRANHGQADADAAAVYEDEGFSGGNLERPAFKRMLRAARERKFKAVVVYRLDRISRNISDFSGLIEELSRLDIAFVSIKEQFDTGTPMGRAMMYIASVFSQLERETIAERIRDNMHELAKTGRWLGGTTPTGYCSKSVRTVTVDGKAKKACMLELIPEEGETVKLVYALFAETHSLTATETELLRRGVTTKNGKTFTRFSIKGILQNPVYLVADQAAYRYFIQRQADVFSNEREFDGVHGVLAYNRTDQSKGKNTVYLPVSEWIVSVGKHRGLISSEVWLEAQAALEHNRSKAYRRPRSNEALLTGLLFCRCGGRMYPKLSKRSLADGTRSYTYVCREKERSRRSLCDGKNADGNMLDSAVLQAIGALAEDKAGFAGRLAQSKGGSMGGPGLAGEKLSALRKELGGNAKKIDALVDSLAQAGAGAAREHILKRIGTLHELDRELRKRIGELERLAAQNMLGARELEAQRRLLAAFPESMETMRLAQKRAAVQALVQRVVWDGESAHVVLAGTAEVPADFLCAEEGRTEREERSEAHGDGNTQFVNTPAPHWREDSK